MTVLTQARFNFLTGGLFVPLRSNLCHKLLILPFGSLENLPEAYNIRDNEVRV